MRELYTHKSGDRINEAIRVCALDEPRPAGASRLYEIVWEADGHLIRNSTILAFYGTEKKGLTNEALLAVVIDRLEAFQRGAFACLENEMALTGARAALEALQKRTEDRIARGVEGTHQT